MQTNYLATQADDIYMTFLIKSSYALVVPSQKKYVCIWLGVFHLCIQCEARY